MNECETSQFDKQRNKKIALGYLEELEAVLLLEYHNKNWLANGVNPGALNEEQRLLVRRIRHLVEQS